jgi:hypothetical protein
MNRALIWALSPALPIFVVALQYWAIRRAPDASDWWGLGVLLATSASAVLAFGAFPRRFWWLAGGAGALAVYGFTVVGMKLNLGWRIVAGAPANWWLELSAWTLVLALPAALVVGVVSAVVSARGLITRD